MYRRALDASVAIVALCAALVFTTRLAPAEEEPLPYDVDAVAEMLVDSEPWVQGWAAHGLRRAPAHLQPDLLEAIHHAAVDAAARRWQGLDDEPLPDPGTKAGARVSVLELSVEPGVLPREAMVVLGQEEAEQLMETVRAAGRVSPRVDQPLYENQVLWNAAPLSTPYVSRQEVVGAGEQKQVEPVMVRLEHGELLKVRPTRVANDGAVTIVLESYWPELTKPMATAGISVGGRRVRVQLPVLHLYRTDVTATLSDGGWLFARARPVFGRKRDGRDLALLVHVKAGDFERAFGDQEPVPEEIELLPPEEADEPPSLSPGFTPR